MKKSTFFHLLITFFFITTSLMAKDSILYMTEEYPPYNFTKDSKVVGISPDLLRVMWSKMGMKEQPIKMMPWARGYELTLTQPNRVLMSMTRIKERETLFKWVGPVASSKYVLIKLASSPINVKSLEEAKEYKIANIRADATKQILQAAGFHKSRVVEITKLDQAIKMLQAKRIDFIAFEEGSFFNIVKNSKLSPSEFKSTLILSRVEDYFAFSKNTPKSTIDKFQNALDLSKKEHKEILNRYIK